ncbi:zincin-like metallopeptidase domain-containing protein [Vibrio aestuarianus]|nr:zincin-like metallopeptidase domain-containing protein [Vibrio aestuarianus]MDE1213234.1 zincin-like metallopeptidase domain-containing protein [Vibrio aestuarianus]MDE1216566.1 zincin-like metallopeptidase domain-containing protein [Vibrio aestuarianus]MDE1267085.1 zincin-like metallopeptidase domain-containing protein [Vibrio aestuarianus]MDE1274597.1 zincin-like metallopeptidase domain-containing protein [Vibrio aestuarianus]MDE1285041.1 zincin-like metallopeptidase domain-containing pro
MSKSKSSAAGSTKNKKSQQDIVLDRLFDFFSKPKGEKPSSDSDVEVSFYRSTLNALPLNFFGNEYNGINIIMLLEAQQNSATKVPIYCTFKQASELLEKHKDQLPDKSDDFDPEKPLKGIKLENVVVKYLENYAKDGEKISKTQFEKMTKGMSFKEMKDKGFEAKRGLRGYRVFPIEKIKYLLPQLYIDEQPYFAKQEALASQSMSEEEQDSVFLQNAKLIIDAMGIPVIEKDEDRAYYSVKEDHIVIPPRDKFKSDKARYAILLHEICHSTGHPSRLDRKLGSPFGSLPYSKEELISETATLFMCLDQGLETFNSHAAYLESWTQQFADQKKALLSVCKQAKEAQNYITEQVQSYTLKLEQQTQRLDLTDQSQHLLHAYFKEEAEFDEQFTPLIGKHITGMREIEDGLELVTDNNDRYKLDSTASKPLSRKVDELVQADKKKVEMERLSVEQPKRRLTI